MNMHRPQTSRKPSAPPWIGYKGDRIASFVVYESPEAGRLVVFMDAAGRTVDVEYEGPLFLAALAFNVQVGTIVAVFRSANSLARTRPPAAITSPPQIL